MLLPLSLSTGHLRPSYDAPVKQMEAIGPDALEAAAHSKAMTPEETEETIDYILNEVLSPSAITAGSSLMSRFEYSMRMIWLVAN